MAEEQKDIDPVTGAEFAGPSWDGIRELKNPSPKWWTILFIIAVIWGVGYSLLYPTFPSVPGLLKTTDRKDLHETLRKQKGPLQEELQVASMDEIQKDPKLYTYARAYGETVFKNNCTSCHGNSAGGTAYEYPSLTDDDWLWPHKPADILQTIRYGVRSGHSKQRAALEMPSFSWMDESTRQQTTEYVLSLQKNVKTLPKGSAGALSFQENCVACHGSDGEGIKSYGTPAINDQVWLFRPVTKKAILAQMMTPKMGQMPAWQDRLSEAELKAVATYVSSLTSRTQ